MAGWGGRRGSQASERSAPSAWAGREGGHLEVVTGTPDTGRADMAVTWGQQGLHCCGPGGARTPDAAAGAARLPDPVCSGKPASGSPRLPDALSLGHDTHRHSRRSQFGRCSSSSPPCLLCRTGHGQERPLGAGGPREDDHVCAWRAPPPLRARGTRSAKGPPRTSQCLRLPACRGPAPG